MATNKTVATKADVEQFLDATSEVQRSDCQRLLKMMQEITGKRPVMWGTSIVGFGSYHYVYASGREGDFLITGFSPRKRNLTIYIMPGFEESSALLAKLGKHKTGKSCLYINKLDDVDCDVLKQLITESVSYMTSNYEVAD